MTEHATLTAERWARFGLAQQILQIALELQRGLKYLRPERSNELRACYTRAFRLVDLTVEVQANRQLRRELLRWRCVLAELFLAPAPDAGLHRSALRVLLQLQPEAEQQVRLLGL